MVVTSSGYGAPVSYHAPTNSYGPPPVDSYGAPSYAAPVPSYAPAPVSPGCACRRFFNVVGLLTGGTGSSHKPEPEGCVCEGYGPPSYSPVPTYDAPAPSYDAPVPTYNAPAPSYGAPVDCPCRRFFLGSSGHKGNGHKGPEVEVGCDCGPAYVAPGPGYGAPCRRTFHINNNNGNSHKEPELPLCPDVGYGAPLPSYGAPSYDAPVDTYGPPVDSYGPPVDSYGPPVDDYAAPLENYGAPGYEAPVHHEVLHEIPVPVHHEVPVAVHHEVHHEVPVAVHHELPVPVHHEVHHEVAHPAVPLVAGLAQPPHEPHIIPHDLHSAVQLQHPGLVVDNDISAPFPAPLPAPAPVSLCREEVSTVVEEHCHAVEEEVCETITENICSTSTEEACHVEQVEVCDDLHPGLHPHPLPAHTLHPRQTEAEEAEEAALARAKRDIKPFVHHELQQNTLGPQAGLPLAPAPAVSLPAVAPITPVSLPAPAAAVSAVSPVAAVELPAAAPPFEPAPAPGCGPQDQECFQTTECRPVVQEVCFPTNQVTSQAGVPVFQRVEKCEQRQQQQCALVPVCRPRPGCPGNPAPAPAQLPQLDQLQLHSSVAQQLAAAGSSRQPKQLVGGGCRLEAVQRCGPVPRTDCAQVPRQECRVVPRQQCDQTPVQKVQRLC